MLRSDDLERFYQIVTCFFGAHVGEKTYTLYRLNSLVVEMIAKTIQKKVCASKIPFFGKLTLVS